MDLIRNIRLLALVGFVSLISCEKEEIEPVSTSSEAATSSVEIKLGKKSDSPLLLRNMQRAADTLASRSQLRSGFTLSATHYYVRFLPANAAEYDTLVADKTLDFTPYPLDCEVSEGDYYHDPSLPKESITWQYTVVPVDFDFSKLDIQHEVLEELYILDDDINSEVYVLDNGSVLRSGANITWKELLTESAIQTGHMGEQTLRAKWTPSATISAYDDRLERYIPLRGVKVRIRYFAFMKAYHYTDSNGYVSFSEKNTSVEYSIEWERDMWDIRDGGVQAYYNGPDRKGAWNLQIGNGTPKSLHISAIHRALYKYYHGDVCGFTRPDKDLKISYEEGSDPDGDDLGYTTASKVRSWSWIFSAIKIYGKNPKTSNRLDVHEVFSTTLHELAHASHACRLSKSAYDETSKTIKESHARFAQLHLTLDEYEKLGASSASLYNLRNQRSLQTWPNNVDLTNPEKRYLLAYSPLFIDMTDTENQGCVYFYYDEIPFDEISGYTIELIDSHLPSLRQFVDVENFLKSHRPSHITENQINSFLTLYRQKWIE